MRFVKKLLHNQSGNAMLEMALVLPLFLFFIMAIINLAVLFSNHIVVGEAVREAGRIIAVTGDPDLAEQKAYKTLQVGTIGSGRSVEVSGAFRNQPYSWSRVGVDTPVFVPGLAKLLDPKAPSLSSKIRLEVETEHYSEARFHKETVRREPIPTGYKFYH